MKKSVSKTRPHFCKHGLLSRGNSILAWIIFTASIFVILTSVRALSSDQSGSNNEGKKPSFLCFDQTKIGRTASDTESFEICKAIPLSHSRVFDALKVKTIFIASSILRCPKYNLYSTTNKDFYDLYLYEKMNANFLFGLDYLTDKNNNEIFSEIKYYEINIDNIHKGFSSPSRSRIAVFKQFKIEDSDAILAVFPFFGKGSEKIYITTFYDGEGRSHQGQAIRFNPNVYVFDLVLFTQGNYYFKNVHGEESGNLFSKKSNLWGDVRDAFNELFKNAGVNVKISIKDGFIDGFNVCQ